MKLYCIAAPTAEPDWFNLYWEGTQLDAKARAKEHGTDFFEIDVPVDKPSLLKWLNTHVVIKQKEDPDGSPP